MSPASSCDKQHDGFLIGVLAHSGSQEPNARGSHPPPHPCAVKYDETASADEVLSLSVRQEIQYFVIYNTPYLTPIVNDACSACDRQMQWSICHWLLALANIVSVLSEHHLFICAIYEAPNLRSGVVAKQGRKTSGASINMFEIFWV